MTDEKRTRSRLDVQLAATLALADRLNTRIPALLNQLNRELREHDGHPDHTSGAPSPAPTGAVAQPCPACEGAGCDNCGPSPSTIVERVALDPRYTAATRDWERARNLIEDFATSAHRLLGLANKKLGPEAAATHADRCTAGLGDSTAIHWSVPECDNLAEVYQRADGGYSLRRDGLCSRCYQAKVRWQRKQEAA